MCKFNNASFSTARKMFTRRFLKVSVVKQNKEEKLISDLWIRAQNARSKFTILVKHLLRVSASKASGEGGCCRARRCGGMDQLIRLSPASPGLMARGSEPRDAARRPSWTAQRQEVSERSCRPSYGSSPTTCCRVVRRGAGARTEGGLLGFWLLPEQDGGSVSRVPRRRGLCCETEDVSTAERETPPAAAPPAARYQPSDSPVSQFLDS